MTFLERAHELNAKPAYGIDGSESMNELLRLRRKCWPEILAVVEAAVRLHGPCPDFGEADEAHDLLGEALEALDKKAGE